MECRCFPRRLLLPFLAVDAINAVELVDLDNLLTVVLDHQVGEFQLHLCVHALTGLDLTGGELLDAAHLNDAQTLVGITEVLVHGLLGGANGKV